MTSFHTDVIVIGAGVSGLAAATEISRAGRSVRVVEARDRVGGRLWTIPSAHGPIEMGGQWISPNQDALLDLVGELGLETFSRYRAGKNVYLNSEGERVEYVGEVMPASAATVASIDRLTAELDRLAAEIDVDEPWAHQSAPAMDQLSFRDWLYSESDDAEARDNIALFVAAAMLTKQPSDFSLLQAVTLAASAGSFSNLVDADIVLDKRVVGGLHQVAQRLSDRLGSIVQLEERALEVRWTGRRATVATDRGEYSASAVLIAVPPNVVSKIGFDPALPAETAQAFAHLSMGNVIKVQAVYTESFWRAAGLSGTAFSPYEVVHEVYDNSSYLDSRGILVGFISDVDAARLQDLEPGKRRVEVLNSLTRYFGPLALDVIGFYESDWKSETLTDGAYGTSFDVGGLTAYGATLQPRVGPLRFGSSDLAGEGYLHVDGALRIGRSMASEVLEQLVHSEG